MSISVPSAHHEKVFLWEVKVVDARGVSFVFLHGWKIPDGDAHWCFLPVCKVQFSKSAFQEVFEQSAVGFAQLSKVISERTMRSM